ncbi:MCP four helix bundle domain-containing protein [Persicitalea jodogahamensis]|uniref:Chemotaxis methyl-accepting receptor HlyB-like 4HB MCP domain-containing protein n=1 Tax=Persicitalea jodogahamensis TaxID=402147 RepID=A0A8J3D3D4_9BACT|nr:MCP four helix bundle domain-containing protein [Persicitalea jodogahamensis]GHB67306.1 hypothetical protein GCM10007390_20770 [Persicitalea jodogahamensis]
MKISLLVTQKVKVAALLLLVMVFVVLFSLRVDNRAHHMDEAVTTVYKDRLQPALIIVYLSENLHAKRILLDNYFGEYSRTPLAELKIQLSDYDTKNDKLVADFEHTILTRNEAAVLAEFKADLAANTRLERRVLQQAENEKRQLAAVLYNREGIKAFRKSIQNLHVLAQIQSETGQEIVQGSHRDAAGVSAITSLLIAVAVIIGILIQSLVHSARFLDRNPSKFNLN